MVIEKNLLMFAAILFGILFSFTFVGAAVDFNFTGSAGSEIANGTTNHTRSIFFNFTFTNGSANSNITDPVNVTVFYNVSGTWTILNNSYEVDWCILATGRCMFNLTIATSNDGVFSLNFSLSNGTDIFNGTSAAPLPAVVRFDSTPPIVLTNNISSPILGSNNSEASAGGLLLLNVSIADAGIGHESVFFNITNTTGASGQNGTFQGTQIGSTGTFNISINTTSFPDGQYNLTVWANDSLLGNQNNSATFRIIIDNTVPSGSLSCTPGTVNSGDAVTCSCGTSDATSGVKTTTFTAKPSTSSTGKRSTSCTITDHASNSITVSTTYIVEQGGGSGGGSFGGGGGSSSTTASGSSEVDIDSFTWTETYIVEKEDFESDAGHSRTLKKEERIQVSIGDEEHFIGVTDVTETTAVIVVASTARQLTFDIGETQKFDVLDDGFYDIQVTLNDIVAGKADVTIKFVHEKIPSEPETTEGEEGASAAEAAGQGGLGWTISIIVIILIIVVGFYLWKSSKK